MFRLLCDSARCLSRESWNVLSRLVVTAGLRRRLARHCSCGFYWLWSSVSRHSFLTLQPDERVSRQCHRRLWVPLTSARETTYIAKRCQHFLQALFPQTFAESTQRRGTSPDCEELPPSKIPCCLASASHDFAVHCVKALD